jgi:AcrR family transcriptional regulator
MSSSLSSKHPYHHGDLRNALLETARTLAQEVGADKLTLREVAKRAGVSHTAAYHHFADKNDLLRALAVQAFHDLNDLQRARLSAQRGIAATLEDLTIDYLQFAIARRAEFSFMWKRELCMPDGEPDPLKDVQIETQKLVTGFLASRVGVDLSDTVDPDLATLSYWSLAQGFTTIVLETPAFKDAPPEQIDFLARAIVKHLLEGIQK